MAIITFIVTITYHQAIFIYHHCCLVIKAVVVYDDCLIDDCIITHCRILCHLITIIITTLIIIVIHLRVIISHSGLSAVIKDSIGYSCLDC